MKQFSILLLILICTQTAYSRTLTRLARAVHSTSRSLHIPPKMHCIATHPKYNINEQDEATQIRAAILQEIHEYNEKIRTIRSDLIDAYRYDKYIKKAENRALHLSKLAASAHHARMKELYAQLAMLEKANKIKQ